jgi:hypothetical protein
MVVEKYTLRSFGDSRFSVHLLLIEIKRDVLDIMKKSCIHFKGKVSYLGRDCLGEIDEDGRIILTAILNKEDIKC